jgi:cytoskeleton protein RodZ
MLRQAREAKGLHIAALAVMLKVPVKKLEALEADRLRQTADAVYVRGLAASVCRALHIDSAPILAGLPALTVSPLATDASKLNQVFDETVPPWQVWRSHPMGMAAGVLLLLALAVWFWPHRIEFAAQEAVEPAAMALEPVASGAPAASVPEPKADQTAQAGVPVAADAQLRQVPAPEAHASEGATAVNMPQLRLADVPASLASMPAANAWLNLHAQAVSWVEVVDARGQVVLRRNLQAGESVALAGDAPMQVVVGKADAVEVRVHGAALDVVSLARDNVARFQVK